MRISTALIALSVSVPAMAAGPTPRPLTHGAAPSANCPRTTSYLADQAGVYRGKPLGPRKLAELPPATGYMAVYRVIGGCETPLTMVDYRNLRRR